jgi:hypothetical protein
MTKKPTIFNATPGTVLDFPSLNKCAQAIVAMFLSMPGLHFVVVLSHTPFAFYLMSFESWRRLAPNHPATGLTPLFSGNILNLRTLADAFPPQLPLENQDAPDA